MYCMHQDRQINRFLCIFYSKKQMYIMLLNTNNPSARTLQAQALTVWIICTKILARTWLQGRYLLCPNYTKCPLEAQFLLLTERTVVGVRNNLIVIQFSCLPLVCLHQRKQTLMERKRYWLGGSNATCNGTIRSIYLASFLPANLPYKIIQQPVNIVS